MDYANNIWVEKYTPKTIDELCIPDHCDENDDVCDLENKVFLADKRIIKNIIENPNEIQNMLFFSERSGTGKTATFELIGKLLGARTKYINASLSGTKGTIENEILTFSQYNSFKSDNVPKLIILDEICGAQAKPFQEPLKATFKVVAKTTRICMTANDIDNVIEALKSRSIKVDFSHSNTKYVDEIKGKMVNRLEQICKLESVEYDVSLLKALVDSNYPDFRTALDNAQMIKKTTGKLKFTATTGKNFIYTAVCDALIKGDYRKAREENLKIQLNSNIFPILLKYFEDVNIDVIKKLNIITIIGDANNYHNECASKEVNIAHMLSRICLVVLSK